MGLFGFRANVENSIWCSLTDVQVKAGNPCWTISYPFMGTFVSEGFNDSVFKTREGKCLFALFAGGIIQGIMRCKSLSFTPV